MPKPNKTFTVKQMKDYIRQHKVNHPAVKLSMKRADLIDGLKKAGHWDTSKDTPTPKKPAPKKKPMETKKKPTDKSSTKMKEYTITTNPDTFEMYDTDFYVNGKSFISYIEENGWELQLNTKMNQPSRWTKTMKKTDYTKFVKRFRRWFQSNQYSISK
jgi:hypothetical protein